jgi:hypothetical protein
LIGIEFSCPIVFQSGFDKVNFPPGKVFIEFDRIHSKESSAFSKAEQQTTLSIHVVGMFWLYGSIKT